MKRIVISGVVLLILVVGMGLIFRFLNMQTQIALKENITETKIRNKKETDQKLSEPISEKNNEKLDTEGNSENKNKENLQKDVLVNDRVIDVETTAEFKRVVNKKNPLPIDYRPGEHPVAKKAFLKLIADMQNLGFKVSNQYSGYRSYEYQEKVYQSIVNHIGQEKADRESARPGHSEHQTGLVFDVKDITGELLAEFKKLDKAAEWLENNAHRYGFVVRYLPDKEVITGYKHEPWHLRFVGNDAEILFKKHLTLEEYYGVEGGDYR